MFKIEHVKRNFNVSLLRDEQKEVPVHLLQLKDIVAILLTGFEESLIYMYINSTQWQKKWKLCKCCCSHCFATQKHHERTK